MPREACPRAGSLALGIRLLGPGLVALGCAGFGLAGLARAEVETLTLYQKTGRAPLVVMADVTDGAHRLAVLRTKEVVKCEIPECPGETFRIAFRLDSFLRKPWEDRITFTTGDEVVLFMRKFTKEDGEQPDNDLYTLMWGSEGIVVLPPEGAVAFVDALHFFAQVGREKDPDLQEKLILEGLRSENPFIIEAAFEESLRQHLGGIDLVEDLSKWFDHPRDDFRVQAARMLGMIVEDARIAGREVPRVKELADLVRGRAALDSSAPFRVAAVTLLGTLGGEESRALLDRLSREDPSQDVRYEASRILLSWNSGS